MDPLDDLLEQLGDVEEEELTPVSKIKEIDIFATESSSTISKETTSEIKHDSDEEDEELYTKRRELSEQGMQLESWLKKNSSTSGPNSTDAWRSKKKTFLTGLTSKKANEDEEGKTTTCVGIFNFDKFQISVRNPKISSHNFGVFTAGMTCEKLSNLKPTSTFKDSWCTMGVIVEKEITKKSANGNEYLIWRLHDLKDCQSPSYKLLLFGDAIKEHWKLTLGTVISLMSPQLSEDNQTSGKKPSATLRVAKSTNIVEIGTSAHFGMCKGVRQQDGQPCNNFVNSSLSEFCVYHVMNAARKIAAKRGTFNAVTCAPNLGGLSIPKKVARPIGTMPKGALPIPQLKDTMKPSNCNSFVNVNANMKTTTKEEEKSTLDEILNQRKNTFAARQFLKIHEKSTIDKPKVEDLFFERKPEKHSSFGDFLSSEKSKETVDLQAGTGGKNLWKKAPIGAKDAQEHAARLRAIAILKKQKEEKERGGGIKRKALEPLKNDGMKKMKENNEEKEDKNSKMDRIRAILARKSLHQGEAEQAESDAIQKHLSSMEEREKIETFTTTCMEVKKVRVVTCNECKYTAQSAAPLCIEKSHKLTKHEADKRFFKCSACKRRVVCFEMMPVKPCNNCNENKWIRVAMRDERKVKLETENLKVRGEERQFVNS
ncbi:unnamed protein product [Caenorhabditis angaria]|uniref:Protein MCM10 homolog n=1 Tax=Caenorhabditis angaria TaxID=860376 RepID=A0A9P1IHF8_9PELO|nr:unnamed protein product [Caenorhabditis angaria]